MEHFVPDLPEQFDSFGEARKNGFLKVRSIKEAGGRVAGISVPSRRWRSWMRLVFSR